MRINVDSHFFIDKRVKRLSDLCSEPRMLTEARLLHVYHECYVRRSAHLSADEIDLQSEWTGDTPFAALMVKALLAEPAEGGGFRVKGVDERIGFLLKSAEWGKKSAEARKEKYGTARPEGAPKVPSENPPECPKVSEPPSPSPSPDQKDLRLKAPEVADATPAPTQPTLLGMEVVVDPTMPPDSFAIVPSKLKKKSGSKASDNAVPTVIGAFITAWQRRYPGGRRPDMGKPVQGMIKNFVAGRPLQECLDMIEVYLQMDDQWFITKCHDFGTLMTNLTKVSAALGSGKQNPGQESWEEIHARNERRRNGKNSV